MLERLVILYGSTDTVLRSALLENMASEFSERVTQLSNDGKDVFDGSLLQAFAENGTEGYVLCLIYHKTNKHINAKTKHADADRCGRTPRNQGHLSLQADNAPCHPVLPPGGKL